MFYQNIATRFKDELASMNLLSRMNAYHSSFHSQANIAVLTESILRRSGELDEEEAEEEGQDITDMGSSFRQMCCTVLCKPMALVVMSLIGWAMRRYVMRIDGSG